MKLQVGDRIKINGWPMLKGLEDGKTYEVYKISSSYNEFIQREVPHAYYFANVLKNGQYGKQRIGHRVADIDSTIDAAYHSRNNIVVIQKDIYSIKDWKGQEVSELSAWSLSEAKAQFSELGYSGNVNQPYSLTRKESPTIKDIAQSASSNSGLKEAVSELTSKQIKSTQELK